MSNFLSFAYFGFFLCFQVYYTHEGEAQSISFAGIDVETLEETKITTMLKEFDRNEEMEVFNDIEEDFLIDAETGQLATAQNIPDVISTPASGTRFRGSINSSGSDLLVGMSADVVEISDDFICSTPECRRVAAKLSRVMNLKADKCDDADDYYCGGWKNSFELPPEEGRWSMSFDSIANTTRHTIKNILEFKTCKEMQTAISNGDVKHDKWDMISTCIYEDCMNTDRLDNRGGAPLFDLMFQTQEGKPDLRYLIVSKYDEELRALTDNHKNEFINVSRLNPILTERLYALVTRLNDISFFGFWIGNNNIHPELNQTAVVYGSGLGISYHLYEEKHLDVQKDYRKHIANILALFDSDLEQYDKTLYSLYAKNNPNKRNMDYPQRASSIYEFERDMRTIMLSPDESRNVIKYTNPITYAKLKESSNIIKIGAIFNFYSNYTDEGTISDDHEFLVQEIDYFAKLENILKKPQHYNALYDYLLFHSIRGYASMLSAKWRDEMERYKTSRTGAIPYPRWRKCAAAPPSWIVARRYIQERFDSRRKAITLDLIDKLKNAFSVMLDSYAWMSAETREKAKFKLDKISTKIAYPEWLVNDSANMYFNKYYGPADGMIKYIGRYFEQKVQSSWVSTAESMSKFKRPIDKTEWHMTPGSVNAYYSSSSNEIAFMAAILEEPSVYVWNTDDKNEELVMKALTFGGIGAVIGHEITHGFDDKGRSFDWDGALKDWWSKDSAEEFDKRSRCVEKQYDSYKVNITLPPEGERDEAKTIEMNIRGQLTLGENLADNGGLQITWQALGLSEKEAKARPLVAYGIYLTVKELFMTGYGTFWCTIFRPKVLRSRIVGDPHSPGKYRIIGALANFEEYGNTYGCKKGDVMMPFNTCRVW